MASTTATGETPPSTSPPAARNSLIDKMEFVPNGSVHPTEKIFKLLNVLGDEKIIDATDNTGQLIGSRQEGDQFPVECVSDGAGASATGVILLRTPNGEGGYDVAGPALVWFTFDALQYALAHGVPTCPEGVGELVPPTAPAIPPAS